MFDVVLINPHWYMARGNLDDLWQVIPDGLASMAAVLRKQGHKVKIMDVLVAGDHGKG